MPENIAKWPVLLLMSSVVGMFFVFVLVVFAMTFTLSGSSTESEPTKYLTMADFDNNGSLDYIAGNSDLAGAFDVALYKNNGSGIFTKQAAFTNSAHLAGLAAGDVNGDGNVDVVLIDGSSSDRISIYLNNGAGVFTLGSQISVGTTVSGIALADVNGDGSLDIVPISSGAPISSIYLNDGHASFSSVSTPPLPSGCKYISASDMNADGKVDLVLGCGSSVSIYANSGTGAFALLGSATSVPNPITAPLALADVNHDGTIDVVACNQPSCDVLTNNGAGVLTDIGTFGTGFMVASSIAVGDMNNDGSDDLVIGGGGGGASAEIFINDGNGTFSLLAPPTEAGDCTQAVGIGDIDGDGDLDYIRGNDDCAGGGAVNRYYKSDQAATLPNTTPTAPSSGFNATLVVGGHGSGSVTLDWGNGSDLETPTNMLHYQPKVGTTSEGNQIVSGRSGSFKATNLTLKNLPCSQTYYWSVATVDTGLKQSGWSAEQTFTLDGSCALSIGGGLSPAPTGGGWAWNVIHQQPTAPPPPPPATLSFSVFQDLNRNKVRDAKEAGESFAGLTIIVHGITADGKDLLETTALDAVGNATLSLSPSSSSGYTVSIDTGSSVLSGFKPTTLTETGGIVLQSNDARSLSFGFRPKNILGYRPCLTIEGVPDPARTSDVQALISALRDSSSLPVLRGIPLTSPLISRGDFLTLLQRTQCIPVDGTPLKNGIFVDITPTAPDAPILAALVSRGFPIARSTLLGPAADLKAPLTRREALLLLASALHPPATDVGTGATLPSDLSPDNALTPVFLQLQDLGILPAGFSSVLASGAGLTPREALTILVRASFVGGKIPVTTPDWEDDLTHAAAPTIPSYLSLFPPLPERSCLLKTPERSTAVRFSDVLPGDALYQDAALLLSLGTKNADGKTLWLLPATSRLAEFGVPAGDVPLHPDAPVSIEETVRSLLVLSCLPIDTSAAVRNGTPALVGTAESNVPRDRVTGLPRDPTLASRIIFKAQDHQRAYDLSLFTYAGDLLSSDIRQPTDPFSIADGAGLFASALLGIAVRDRVITPQDAELKAAPVRQAILASLLGRDSLTWRDGDPGHADPLTRRMLIQFLAAVTAKEQKPTPDVTLGKLWWERVK